MEARIIDSSGPLSEEELRVAERELGLQLPSAYRKFLLTHNGGKPVPGVFNFKGRDGSPDRSVVDWFLSVHEADFDNLLHYAQTYRGRIPEWLVPIGHDPYGNLILLGHTGTDTGAVFFWDHEQEISTHSQSGAVNVFRVANSFQQFLDQLYEVKDEM